jgi:hypothetical protein
MVGADVGGCECKSGKDYMAVQPGAASQPGLNGRDVDLGASSRDAHGHTVSDWSDQRPAASGRDDSFDIVDEAVRCSRPRP